MLEQLYYYYDFGQNKPEYSFESYFIVLKRYLTFKDEDNSFKIRQAYLYIQIIFIYNSEYSIALYLNLLFSHV
jgi:hypothetical protein